VIGQQIFVNVGASNFPFKSPFKKCFKIAFLSLWRRDPVFGAAIADAVARSSIVFCNSVSADRIVMVASRLLGAAAACVILLSFAAESCKSYILKWRHQGCDSDLSLDFLNFGAGDIFFGSVAACVSLLSFAAESCESYGNGW
jgi:hypothetical protein